YGATAADIIAATDAVRAKGLEASVDPSRAFLRATGTAQQWQRALGHALKVRHGNADAPFDFYDFASTPNFGAKLKYVGTGATLYRPDLDTGRDGTAANTDDVSSAQNPQSWPLNQGKPGNQSCSQEQVVADSVYTPEQIATAYGTGKLSKEG